MTPTDIEKLKELAEAVAPGECGFADLNEECLGTLSSLIAALEAAQEQRDQWKSNAITLDDTLKEFRRDLGEAEAALKEAQSRLIRGRLSAFYEKHEIAEWMNNPHPLLGGKSADEMISAGKAVEVERVISQLEDGVHLYSGERS